MNGTNYEITHCGDNIHIITYENRTKYKNTQKTHIAQKKHTHTYIYLFIYLFILLHGLWNPDVSILHSEGLSNNPYPESNQPNFSYC